MRSVFGWMVAVFLLVSAAFCAAEDLPDQGSPLAVRLMSYGKYQDAAWSHLQQIGVHYLFLSVPAPDQAEAVQKQLAEHDLKALVMRGEADLSKEECVEQLAAQLATCEKMGVHYMFISAKRNDAPKEIVFERLRKAGDIAKQRGVTITMETHPDLCTNADVQLETMKALDHPNLRVNFDTANITYYNKGADAVAELKKIIPYVKTVEFKDHNLEFETWNFPPLGRGKVDFPALLKLLRDNQYMGPITIEFEGVKGVELDEEQTKQSIAASVAYLKTLANFK